MKKTILLILFLNLSPSLCQSITFSDEPELFAPGVISIENSEVKITFSKDGKLVLWGAVGRKNGIGGLDIWQSEKTENGWGTPQSVSFNTADNDFDPCFSADGKIVYFFSNRVGGIGGDDIYYVQYNSLTRKFGTPVNMGNKINTAGDEWGPTESIDGEKFIFCTDGIKGKGKHDIFICNKTSDGWSFPQVIESINSDEDDFDPILLSDCNTIIFTRKYNEDEAYMFVSFLSGEGYSEPERISDQINIPGTWNFGSSLDPLDHSYFYYSTHNEKNSRGRVDIYRVKYTLQ
ncbi:MAG: hypothetical protein AB1521_16100 [Bacteroidota bacterium]